MTDPIDSGAELTALRAEVETLRMQLAGCGVIAKANTRDSAAKVRDMHPAYWCASLRDVADAVDREIELREKLADAEDTISNLSRALDEELGPTSADLAASAPAAGPDKIVADLAMLVTQLAYRLKRCKCPGLQHANDMRAHLAMDFLLSRGLTSPLRDDDAALARQPAADPEDFDAECAAKRFRLIARILGVERALPEWNDRTLAANLCTPLGIVRGALEQRLAAADRRHSSSREPGFIKPDSDTQVFFYEQDFYVLSNFSAFALEWKDHLFPTSEHAYHWEKFRGSRHPDAYHVASLLSAIRNAPSAHEAFTLAQRAGDLRRPDWDDVKVDVMRDLLRAKVRQHEYVRRKLLATGSRELVEDSWRDRFWGWGPYRDGHNMLGKLWMEIRAELRGTAAGQEGGAS